MDEQQLALISQNVSQSDKSRTKLTALLTVGDWHQIEKSVYSGKCEALIYLNTMERQVKDVVFDRNDPDEPTCLIYFVGVNDLTFRRGNMMIALPPDDFCTRVQKSTTLTVRW